MDWTRFFWMFARAALRVLADELDPAGRRRRPKKDAARPKARKQPKTPPQAEPKQPPQAAPKQPPQAEPSVPYAPQSAASAGWGVSAEPPPVPVIRIETDDGSTVSPLSVLGERAYVGPRPQRERKPGESRRVRRTARAEIPEPTPRSPEMTACVARMRARASGTACPPREASPTREAPQLPLPARRRRSAGEPLALTQLAPATLLLLQSGEPWTHAAKAASGER